MYNIGIDVGGTYLKFGVVDENYNVNLYGRIKVFSDDSIKIFSIFIVFIKFVCLIFSEDLNRSESLERIAKNNLLKDLQKIKDRVKKKDKIDRHTVKQIVEFFYENKNNFEFKDKITIIKNDNLYKRLTETEIVYRSQYSGEVKTIGVAMPGFPDEEKKMIVSGNPNLANASGDSFNNYTTLDIHLVNDVTAQGFYFNRLAEGENFKNFIVLAIGTGIGGAIIINNQVYMGSNGWAGEVGHFPINFNSNDKCNCGATGCSEVYGSVRNMIEMAKNVNTDFENY